MKLRLLLLLLLLWLSVSYYFPDTRQALANAARPLWNPVVEWNTREEMRQVGRDVIRHETNAGRLPSRRDWLDWLDYRYPTDELKLDAWGSAYELRASADSVWIVSYGLDRTRGTGDDIEVATHRPRRRR